MKEVKAGFLNLSAAWESLTETQPKSDPQFIGGLPNDPLLEEELRTCRGFLNPTGKLQIISKDDWRQIIHWSSDRLDSVVMACAGRGYASFGSGACDHSGPVAF